MKLLKKAPIIFLALSCSALAILVSYLMAEAFFFDKIFYQKSTNHGYKTYLSLSHFPERADDLIALHKKLGHHPNVLGKSDNSAAYTILVIGDSYVWGQGVRHAKRFAEILNNKLAATKNFPEFKVVSLGTCGDSILDYLTLYKAYIQVEEVDLVVFGLMENDLLYKQYNGDFINHNFPQFITQPIEKILNNCSKPLINGESDRGLRQELELKYGEALDQSTNPQYGNLCILDNIITHLPHDNAIYFDYGYPFNSQPSLRKHYIDFLSKNGFEVVTQQYTEKELERKEELLVVSQKDYHPSTYANRLFAETLYQEIIKRTQ